MANVEELHSRIVQLEKELNALKNGGPVREKITEMTAEVVDSNPYRYMIIKSD